MLTSRPANITGIPLVGTPDEFSRGIKSAVELLRKRIRGFKYSTG